MATVYLRAAARDDLMEHFIYLSENAGADVAERFLTSAETSFNDLADRPRIGSPLKLRHSALEGMRKWGVKDFGSHLIFYVPREDGVSAVRVLHGGRDWWSLLDVDE